MDVIEFNRKITIKAAMLPIFKTLKFDSAIKSALFLKYSEKILRRFFKVILQNLIADIILEFLEIG